MNKLEGIIDPVWCTGLQIPRDTIGEMGGIVGVGLNGKRCRMVAGGSGIATPPGGFVSCWVEGYV